MRTVIILTRGERIRVVFEKPQAIPDFVQIVRELLGDNLKGMFLVDSLNPTPRPEGEVRRGKLWCPYCARFRKFLPDKWDRVKCEVCGISTMCFHVRKENNLWNMDKIRRRRRK